MKDLLQARACKSLWRGLSENLSVCFVEFEKPAKVCAEEFDCENPRKVAHQWLFPSQENAENFSYSCTFSLG